MAVRAVAFEFVTMGEAARSIPAAIQARYPGILWDKMQVIRNVIVHEYFRIMRNSSGKPARKIYRL